MNGIVESPFFKVFTTTNSLLLGAGALYLVSFGRESRSKTTADQKAKFGVFTSGKPRYLNDSYQSTESQGDLTTFY
jgi:hypothetical protein